MPTMNSWKSGLNSASSEHLYTRPWSPLPIEWRIAFRVASWSHSSLWACLNFLRMCLSRLSLVHLCLAILFVAGLAYGLSTSFGDHAYAFGMDERNEIRARVDQFRIAAKYNPFDHNSRSVGASLM